MGGTERASARAPCACARACHPAVQRRGAAAAARAARPRQLRSRPPRASAVRAVAQAVQRLCRRPAALLRGRGSEATEDPQGELQ